MTHISLNRPPSEQQGPAGLPVSLTVMTAGFMTQRMEGQKQEVTWFSQVTIPRWKVKLMEEAADGEHKEVKAE